MRQVVRIAERFQQLWGKELQRLHKRDEALMEATFTRSPVKNAMVAYIRHRDKEVSGEHISSSLKLVGMQFKARYDAISDFPQMQRNWHFVQMMEDLNKLLSSDAYLPPDHIANIIEGLSNAGHKDHDLILQLLNRVTSQPKYENPLNDAISSLLETNTDQISEELCKLEGIISSAINAGENFKTAIAEIRAQYAGIIERQQQNFFLQSQVNIRTSIYQVQEGMVKAGLANAEDFESRDQFYNQDRIDKIYNDIVENTFPSVNLMQDLQFFYSPETNSNPYDLNDHNISRMACAMASALNIRHTDFCENWSPNALWTRQANDEIPDGVKQDKLTPLDKECTKLWTDSVPYIKSMAATANKVIKGGSVSDLLNMAYGFAQCRIGDVLLYRKIEQHLRSSKTWTVATESELANGMYGLAMANTGKETVASIAAEFARRELSSDQLIRGVWAMCLHKLYDHAEFPRLLKRLNAIAHPNGFLSDEDANRLQEIYWSIRLETDLDVSPAFKDTQRGAMVDLHNPIKEIARQDLWALADPELTIEERKASAENLSHLDLPYKPDSTMIYNNKVVPVYLLLKEGITCDTEKPMGDVAIRLRHLSAMGHHGLALDINQFMDINCYQPEISFKENNYIQDQLWGQLGKPKTYLDNLDKFVSKLLKETKRKHKMEENVDPEVFELLNGFLNLYKLQTRTRHAIQEDQVSQMMTALNNEIRLLKYLYAKMNNKTVIDELVASSSGHSDLSALLNSVNISSSQSGKLESWMGTRQGIELSESAGVKDIVPELINQDFMWIEDYHHYADWEQMLSKAYPLAVDMDIDAHVLDNKFYFGKRRQQYGMTPRPNLQRNSIGAKIGPAERLMASLSNLKYELKRNSSDAEILHSILNLDLVGQIIQDHMKPAKQVGKVYLLRRDPSCYVNFLQRHMTHNTDAYSEYFNNLDGYLKGQEDAFMSQWNRMETIKHSPSTVGEEGMGEIYTQMREYQNNHEDRYDLQSDFIFGDSRQIDLKIHTQETKKSSKRFDMDRNLCADDQEFLDLKRIKAEAKLTKAAIIYKLSKKMALSKDEIRYAKAWKHHVSTKGHFLPKTITSQTLGNLTPHDTGFIMSINGVDIGKEAAHVSANELILELSHFIDEDVITRVEDKMRGFEDFSANKETSLINQEIEEQLWRRSGQMTEEDMGHFKEMYMTMRNKSYQDRLWWGLDMKSLDGFMEKANDYDSRLTLLKLWYKRKENEHAMRKTPPYENFAKADDEYFGWTQELYREQGKPVVERMTETEWDKIQASQLETLANELMQSMSVVQLSDDFYDAIRGVMLHPALDERVLEQLTAVSERYRINPFDMKNEKPLSVSPVELVGDYNETATEASQWKQRLTRSTVDFVGNVVDQLNVRISQ